MITATIILAFRSLRRNPLRSFLTTIGIVIGVASVIAMVTLARGASARVTSEISSLGNNLLILVPGAARRVSVASTAQPFTLADATAIRAEIPNLAAVAPSVGMGGQVVFGDRNWRTGVTGATNDYFRVRNWALGLGREFSEAELRAGSPVCVVGETVRRNLFDDGDPIGARIRVATISCEIIGVLESKGQSTFGEDQDDFMVMPLLAMQRRLLGSENVGVIAVSAAEGADTNEIKAELELLMRQRRRIREGDESDFSVRDLKEVTQIVGIVGSVLTTLLGAIAAVSLLVGGIGIMNIMLVSVTERTREIGIRLAIGARSGEILAQFLVEAVVLSLFGGIIGIVVGLGGSALAMRGLSLPFVLSWDVVGGAFGFAAFVGVFFGWYPARRAAHALRHQEPE